jgi:hypothetical protein
MKTILCLNEREISVALNADVLMVAVVMDKNQLMFIHSAFVENKEKL